MKRLYILPLIVLFISLTTGAQKIITLKSPDQRIVFVFRLSGRSPQYSVQFKGQEIISNASLGLTFKDFSFTRNIRTAKPVYKDTIEAYTLIVGKAKNVVHPYHQVMIPLISDNRERNINLVVKVFNDGVAFSYFLPQQKEWDSYTLTEENTSFNFTGNPIIHALLLPSYTTSHEGLYTTTDLQHLKADTLLDMPVLVEYPGRAYVGITEAALLNYAGMYLMKHNGILSGRLSPLPGQSLIKVSATLPHQTPWRVLLIGDRPGALIESNILTSLCPPLKINDVSWIKPGKTTFPWWNGDITPDTTFAPGNNFETNKYYIDFCARNNIEYHSVVEYGGHEWYMNDGDGFAPGPHADVLTPVPTLNMPQICAYAREKGVGIRVWVFWSALYPKLDSAFALYHKWGIKGLMVDFLDRDDQEMVLIQEKILQKAAQYQLHIQFHGAYKPTGLNRTYPNEFTREGTLNYEADKWNEHGISPDHDINMPFTRMLAGSTDYHLGGFRAITPKDFKVQYTRPLVLGTRCHMLAMYVVLENYLGMVCDYPAAYEGEKGFDFIKEVPTVWDETKVIDAKVGGYIVIARRKNSKWYLGIINNHEARRLNLKLDFLQPGKHKGILYSDTDNTDLYPNNLNVETRELDSGDLLTIKLSSGGGAAIIID